MATLSVCLHKDSIHFKSAVGSSDSTGRRRPLATPHVSPLSTHTCAPHFDRAVDSGRGDHRAVWREGDGRDAQAEAQSVRGQLLCPLLERRCESTPSVGREFFPVRRGGVGRGAGSAGARRSRREVGARGAGAEVQGCGGRGQTSPTCVPDLDVLRACGDDVLAIG